MLYKPQSEFPLLERYKEVFKTNEHTIFAYNKVIYCNQQLPQHLEIHERRHLIRQQNIGVDLWCEKYLTNTQFRLNEEVIAYREQLLSIKDRSKRHQLRLLCAKDLSSPLYGGICNYQEAIKLLQV